MCECGIGPDYQEDFEEMFLLMESAGNVFSDALELLLVPASLVQLLLQSQYSYIWDNCLKPFIELLDEILFVATRGKEGKILKAHCKLSLDSLQWQFMWARNVYRQIKNPIPGDIRNFLRQAKKIAALIHKTRSVEIADKETYQTIVAFLKIAGSYKY
jgi:hypothetical protein